MAVCGLLSSPIAMEVQAMNCGLRPNRLSLAVLLLAAVGCSQAAAGDPDPLAIFNQRIIPIFRSEKPSSCVQCHLSSVDLKEYILPSAEKTFLSLRDQGLIDLEAPEKSKILELIKMGEKDADEGARLIHAKTRQAEYEAFAAWIAACVRDERLRNLPPLSAAERAGPEVPDAVIRHARKSHIVESFARSIWSQRLRCFPCHTPFELDPQNRRQAAAFKTMKQLKERYGEEKVKQLGFIRETPEATLQRFVEMSRNVPRNQLPMINLQEPLHSLLLQKPLARLPAKGADGKIGDASNEMPVSHGGGIKMHLNDPAYKAFASWLIDYAKTVKGEYRSVDELPQDNWVSTEFVIRVMSIPERWKPLTTVQVVLHRWNEEQGSWSDSPFAYTQSVITPRRFVNGTLFVFRQEDAGESAADRSDKIAIPRGKYQIKLYVDSRKRLNEDPTLLLGREDYVGELTLDVRRWRAGFKNAKKVSAESLGEGTIEE